MSPPDEAERLDVFMARANARYYAACDPFADFTTAPEIGQVFGELLGAWAAVTWAQMGAPDPVLLVEAGPGRGTLMADLRRATLRVAPAFHAACRVHFVETSPRLRAEQAARVPARWHATLDDVPAGSAIVLANEFLDALPIRQFVRRADGWTERHVQDGAFIERPRANDDETETPLTMQEGRVGEGGIVETSPAALSWVRTLAGRLVRDGGAALILDYGPAESAPGESLQAIRDAAPAHPLTDPGRADITAHVDFAALTRVARARGAACWGPVPQGIFLQRLGLQARTERLALASPHHAAALREAAARLAAPQRMGALFKVLCLAQPGLPVPAGLA